MTVPLWSHRYTCSGPWWHTTVWPTHRSVTSCFLVSCTASLHNPPNQGPYNSLAYLFIQQDWSYAIIEKPQSDLHTLTFTDMYGPTYWTFLTLDIYKSQFTNKKAKLYSFLMNHNNKHVMNACLVDIYGCVSFNRNVKIFLYKSVKVPIKFQHKFFIITR